MITEDQLQAFNEAMDKFRIALIERAQIVVQAFQPLLDAYQVANRRSVVDRRKLSRRRARRRSERRNG